MVYVGKSIERDMYYGAKPELFRLALRMRRYPTESEEILWVYLKKFRRQGFIFRRQHPIDIFIADFYCHKLKLVIEIDGEIHNIPEVEEHDIGRTAELDKLGIKIIRFTNSQVFDNIGFVLNEIAKTLNVPISPALPGAGD